MRVGRRLVSPLHRALCRTLTPTPLPVGEGLAASRGIGVRHQAKKMPAGGRANCVMVGTSLLSEPLREDVLPRTVRGGERRRRAIGPYCRPTTVRPL
ncbi:hypothetical protein GGR66_003218 [Xanthomonas sp. 3498]|nr:hypothetical protein [Xanthomonas sp. 3498]